MLVTIDPPAIVDAGAQLGNCCRVGHFFHTSAGAQVGRGCSFGRNVYVGNDVRLCDSVEIQSNVSVYDAVALEAEEFFGPRRGLHQRLQPAPGRHSKEKYAKPWSGERPRRV